MCFWNGGLMRISDTQIAELRSRGIYITEACDSCGQLLGSVRWTRKGEPGEWCSRECRDGKSEAQKHEARISAKAGRPRLKLSETGRIERNKQQSRERSRRYRRSVTQNCQQPTETAEVAGAILQFSTDEAYA
jgi:hypothetical protein